MIRTKSHAATLLAAPILFAMPAQAEVSESSATHFVSRHAVEVAAEPKDVWLALISPADWWNDSHTWSADAANLTLTPQAGGCFCERIPAEDGVSDFGLEGSAQHMAVVQAVPRKVLRMRGALGPLQSEPVDGVMTITLQEIDAGGEDAAGDAAEGEGPGPSVVKGTRIVWEYVVGGTMRFEVPQISKAVDGVIGQQVAGLAEALGGPLSDEPARDTFDDAFGADEEAEETPTTGLGEGR